MSFTDSITCNHMPPVKDYKRAYYDDKGPNTGSMGSISLYNHTLPFLTDDDLKTSKMLNEIVIQSLKNFYLKCTWISTS